jgi:hypothetical protein
MRKIKTLLVEEFRSFRWSDFEEGVGKLLV